jgi:hypothetical protein
MDEDQLETLVGGAAVAFGFTMLVVIAAVAVLMILSCWKVFTKAGKPGWAAIVPVYNMVVVLEIIGRPLWWILLMLVPLLGIVIGFIISIDLARSFGKGAGFGVGLMLLGVVFYPILAFGDARYQGPSAPGSPAAPTPQWTPQT